MNEPTVRVRFRTESGDIVYAKPSEPTTALSAVGMGALAFTAILVLLKHLLILLV